MEIPIVVDVDNDGTTSEVVLDPNYAEHVRARNRSSGIGIWRGHLDEPVGAHAADLEPAHLPRHQHQRGRDRSRRIEEINWHNGRLNNFRQNVQPGGLFDAPDLQITEIELAECIPMGTLRIAVTVTNQGALGVPPGIDVYAALTTLPDGTVIPLGVEMTTMTLLPGQSEVLVFTYTVTGGFTFTDFTVEAIADDDGTGMGEYNECDEDNNGLTSETLMTCSFG